MPITLNDLDDLSWRIARAEGWGWTKDEAEEARLEAHAEWLAENAYVRYQENRPDPEAEADLALHDFLHPNGYGR
jgi:hypothetical protein